MIFFLGDFCDVIDELESIEKLLELKFPAEMMPVDNLPVGDLSVQSLLNLVRKLGDRALTCLAATMMKCCFSHGDRPLGYVLSILPQSAGTV